MPQRRVVARQQIVEILPAVMTTRFAAFFTVFRAILWRLSKAVLGVKGGVLPLATQLHHLEEEVNWMSAGISATTSCSVLTVLQLDQLLFAVGSPICRAVKDQCHRAFLE